MNAFSLIKKLSLGSGCGSVGRVVASNIRGPLFESSNWQNFIVNCIKKTKIKKKRPGMAHFCLKMSFIRSAAEAQKLLCLNTFNLSSLSCQSAS